MIGLNKKDKEEKTEEVKVSTKATAELKKQIKDGLEEEAASEEVIIPPIGPKEIRSLNRHNYEKVSQNFDKIFLIRNRRTNQIVELRAASSAHACTMIGWKPKHVRLMEEKSTNKEVKPSSVKEIVTDQVDKFNDAISTASSSKSAPSDVLSGK